MYSIFRKKSSRYILCYLLIWILSGVLYWCIAISTDGEAYQFQEDILLKAKAKAFSQKTNTPVGSKYIIDLFKSFDEKELIIKVGNSKEETYLHIMGQEGLQNIKPVWVEYYMMELLKERFDYYEYSEVSRESIIGADLYVKVKMTFHEIPDKYVNKVTKSELKLLSNKYSKYIKSSKAYIVFIKEGQYKKLDFNSEIKKDYVYFPTEFSRNFIAASVNYLNDDYEIVKDFETRFFSYSIMDFLYFSAVTITTLGYGDILPNSTGVRIIVTMEAILGIIVIGLFVSQKLEEINGNSLN